MGMGNPLDTLRRTVITLEKTWQAWFEEGDTARNKKLEQNFEYLLAEAEIFLGFVKEEWRTAFKKPIKTPKYDWKLQREMIDKFVPSWNKPIKKRKLF